MFCTKCGTQLGDETRFCPSCGKPAQDTTAEFVPAPPRKLRRLTSQKKIAGVCAGFAEYFDTDITLMRLIWVALALIPPSVGLPVYVIAWIVLPRDDRD